MKTLRTLFFISVVLLSGCSIATADAEIRPLDKILQLAAKKQVSESRAWKKLLHIEPNLLGLNTRQISDPGFYISNSPEYSKLNELEATLAGFAEPPEKYARVIDHPLKKNQNLKVLDHSQHPICRFPARLGFLQTELRDSREYWLGLPKLNCVYQDIFLEAVDPESVSFVFSSYYSDSPGSAFGHTFFRINRNTNVAKTRQELLDYGVGFAANVTVSNSALYAVLGLVGGFSGSWSNLPYYYKVREYNNFEARDLWSYDLNLLPAEVKMLALHLWEVGPHFYTYYFFTQNCAFHMLTLLEAAAPRLHLTEHVPFYYVIPSDSLKALFYEEGLVKEISFRPSIRKVFLERTKKLDPLTYTAFANYAGSGDFAETKDLAGDQQRALFLDAAMDLVDLRNPNLTLEKNRDQYLKKNELLEARSRTNYISPEVEIKTSLADQPEGSHGSSRLGLSYQEKNGIKGGNLTYRFALHDLQDPQVGLPQNSQLEFFNFNFRVLPGELKFEEMNIFKVFNLNPVNFFEKKASWGFELGVQNKHGFCPLRETDCFLYGALAKYGTARSFGSENLVGWGLGIFNLRYGQNLPDSDLYAAAGFEFGMLYRFNTESSFLTRFAREYPAGRAYEQNYEVEIRHSPVRDTSFGLRVRNDEHGVLFYYYY